MVTESVTISEKEDGEKNGPDSGPFSESTNLYRRAVQVHKDIAAQI